MLIIDANVRKTPVNMSKVLNIDDTTGLTDVFDGQVAFEDAVQILGPNFSVLTAGKTIIIRLSKIIIKLILGLHFILFFILLPPFIFSFKF